MLSLKLRPSTRPSAGAPHLDAAEAGKEGHARHRRPTVRGGDRRGQAAAESQADPAGCQRRDGSELSPVLSPAAVAPLGRRLRRRRRRRRGRERPRFSF